MKNLLRKLMRRPLCLAVAFYAIIVFSVQIFMPPPQPGAAHSFTEGEEAWLTGRLYKKEIKNNRRIYYLKEVQIKEKSEKNSKVLNVICHMSDEAGGDVPVGRWLYVKGKVLPFEPAENEGQFDALSYYEGLGISLRLWNTAVISQGTSYDAFEDAMVDIKVRASMKYKQYMSPENAGILSAMVLGDKTSMDSEVKNLYRKSGIAHVLAISGLHISLLGMSLYRLLRRAYVPPQLCSMFGIVFAVVYIKFAGFSMSSFRAVCMFVMFMLADLLGRTYDLLTALFFSAFLLLIDNPGALFEAGFLLSYFAVFGLAVVLPILKTYIPWKAAGPFLPGFSVQILIFPMTLWFYYEFPIYSFLLNLIIVPCMSAVLLSGITGTVPGCGFVLCLTDLLLQFYEWLCRMTELLPGAVVVTGRPEVWQMVLYYALIVLWLVRAEDAEGKEGAFRAVFRAAFPLVCMLLFLLPVHREDRVDMLSVGQGDCVIMRDCAGKVAIVDGGSTDVSEVGKYRVLPFLKYHGISDVDVVFLSHAHVDHYSAMIELLETSGKEGVRVRTLCLSGYASVKGGGDSAYGEIVSAAQRAGCEIVYMNPGDRIVCGEMEFDCVYPDRSAQVTDENDSSMVLLARLSGFSMLFTGDSTSACDEEVIRRLRAMGVREIDCLKVAHHGAQTSTSAELLDEFDFSLALISCGEGNSYGHPHADLLSRLRDCGCTTFVTACSGQVTLRIEEGVVRAKVYREKFSERSNE